MRLMMFAAAIAMIATMAFTGERALAADRAQAAPSPALARGIDINIDDEDDNVLEVQVIVLGVVIGTVFVLGTGAWLLRRRLGLTAYTPPADSGHH